MIENPTPTNEIVKSLITGLKKQAQALESIIIETIPASRERSLALTNLEQASMWTTKAVLEAQDSLLMRALESAEAARHSREALEARSQAAVATAAEAPVEPEPVEAPATEAPAEPELAADLAPT